MRIKNLKMRTTIFFKMICGLLLAVLMGCYSNEELFETENTLKAAKQNYNTENVILVMVDGPRQSETWQSTDRKYIPMMDKYLAPQGIVISAFYNNGVTFTVPGHVATLTGTYESISNKGEQLPTKPSFFQMWLKVSAAPKEKAWIITSKSKLNVLANCKEVGWRNSFNPSVDAADRDDIVTYNTAKEIMQEHKPNLVLLHFRGPDTYGHAGNWEKYVESIAIADSLLYELWNFVESSEFYKDNTTMIMTNDHGRHLDQISGGFEHHGDHCLGCRHLNFYAVGPDFKQGEISSIEREQTNILPTVAELMGFELEDSKEIMWELFK